jgi:hypothetical protein
MLLVPQPLAAVLAFCDGTRSPQAMVSAYEHYYGVSIGLEMVDELLRAMDDAYLLDNAQSEEAHQSALDEYRRASFRPPLLAGQGYPSEAADLHVFLEEYLDRTALAIPARKREQATTSRFGLLSPHIDYTRGGDV